MSRSDDLQQNMRAQPTRRNLYFILIFNSVALVALVCSLLWAYLNFMQMEPETYSSGFSGGRFEESRIMERLDAQTQIIEQLRADIANLAVTAAQQRTPQNIITPVPSPSQETPPSIRDVFGLGIAFIGILYYVSLALSALTWLWPNAPLIQAARAVFQSLPLSIRIAVILVGGLSALLWISDIALRHVEARITGNEWIILAGLAMFHLLVAAFAKSRTTLNAIFLGSLIAVGLCTSLWTLVYLSPDAAKCGMHPMCFVPRLGQLAGDAKLPEFLAGLGFAALAAITVALGMFAAIQTARRNED